MVGRRITAARRTGGGGVGPGAFGGGALVAAGLLVGVAIAADGAVARSINGLGGLVWLAALGLLARSVRREPRRLVGAGTVIGAALALTFLVPPSELLPAVLGFLAAGAVTAALVRRRGVTWALLVPAAWLPIHLGVAVGRAAWRAVVDGAPAVRTDPPPTAALVPLAMVVAAGAGGLAVARWRARQAPTAAPVREATA